MTNMIKDRCIWVTGATSGIGEAVVGQLIQQGNLVVATGRNQHKLDTMASRFGARLVPLRADLSGDQAEFDRMAAALAEKTDYLDVVICCAGVCEYEDDLTFDLDMYRRVFEVNFFGVLKTFKAALPLLKKSDKRAQFVALGSLSSVLGLPRAEAYGASKAALDYFMASLKADLIQLPIDTTVVRPGFVKTALTDKNDFDMPFLVSADKAAHIICEGIARRKSDIEFPRRLSWSIRLLANMQRLWFKVIAPKMTRVHAADWRP